MAPQELNDRRDYGRDQLDESNVDADPFAQFHAWLDLAQASPQVDEALAMTLATADADGTPSARIVLLRSVTNGGFTFFTNYTSHKGHDLDVNQRAALVFYWGPLERQVRVEGTVEKLPAAESDEYFASRPYKSRLGALASNQSSPATRAQLDASLEELQAAYPEGSEIPRPDHWGGYRVTPTMFEFWQGRRSRMHDRLQFVRNADGWQLQRLAP